MYLWPSNPSKYTPTSNIKFNTGLRSVGNITNESCKKTNINVIEISCKVTAISVVTFGHVGASVVGQNVIEWLVHPAWPVLDVHSIDPFFRCLAFGVPGNNNASALYAAAAKKGVKHDKADGIFNRWQSVANNFLIEKTNVNRFDLFVFA